LLFAVVMAAGAGLLLVVAFGGILLARGTFSAATGRPPVPTGNRDESNGAAIASTGGASAKGNRAVIAPELRAYMVIQKKLNEVVREVTQALSGVTDSASAASTGPQLSRLLPDLEKAMQEATAALLVVEHSPIAKQQLTRVMIQQNQADSDFARQVLAGMGVGEPSDEIGDLGAVMVRVAKNPEAAPIHDVVRELRDLLLRGRAPLAPLLARKRLEKDLGPLGSPLQPR
jgi:hypothetical protein